MHHSLFKSVATYGFADILQKAISFITLPVFSHYILPEDLGMVANYDVIVNIIILVSGQAVINALTYFFYQRSKHEIAVLISNLILLVICMNVLFDTFILSFSKQIASRLSVGIGLQLLAMLCAVASLLSSVDSVVFRLEENARSFVTLNLSSSITATMLMCYFILFKDMGGIGKIYGHAGAMILFCLIHVYLLYRRGYIVFKVNKNDIRTLLRFGVPLLPHSLSFWIKGGMDKILLTSFYGLAANGLYSMAMSFGAIYSLFQNSFTYAYAPYLQKRIAAITQANKDEEKRRIVLLSYKVMVGFVVIGLIATLISWFVITYMLSDKYAPSFQFIPWVMASLSIYSIYSLTIEFAYTSKNTAGIGGITFTGSLIQCGCTFLFLQWFGVEGIKYSLIVGSMFIMLGIWIYSNKVYPMPWLDVLKGECKIA